ncbi:MAG: hypothetical protein O3C40_24395 [Planctomycetota bacterium]|nr:hypothetical protein [Planctomycetota bacterium]
MKLLFSGRLARKSFATLIALIAVGTGCQTQIDPKDVPKFVVRAEEPVTDIVSPLTDDGYIDYLEAANLRHSEGVTPETNWEVVVRTAFGPVADFDEPSQQQFYQRLGISVPTAQPGAGEYFQSLRLGGKGVSELEMQLAEEFHEMKGPWRAAEFPELAKWLDRQSRQVDNLVSGSRCARYYAPYCMSEAAHVAKVRSLRSWYGGLQSSSDKAERFAALAMSGMFAGLDEHPVPLSRLHIGDSVQQSRESARVLRIRALLRIGEGDIDAARSDILAIHRIGRLLAQGMLDEWLIGNALEEVACYVDADLLQSGKLTSELASQHLDELNRLPPLRSAIEELDVDLRHVTLDAMQYAARRRQELAGILDAEQPELDGRTIKAILDIDWNAAMRVLNEKFDEYVKASQEAAYARNLPIKQHDMQKRAAEQRELFEAMKEAANEGTEALSRFIGEMYFNKYMQILPKVELRPQARLDVVRVGYAAHLHRLQEGRYPTSLDVLAPMVNDRIVDPYTGKPLVLKSVADGIVVYSVGPNLVDDGGLTHDDGSNKDDIVLRLTEARDEPAE